MSLVAAEPYKTFDDLRGKTIGSQTLTTGTGFALLWCCAPMAWRIRAIIKF